MPSYQNGHQKLHSRRLYHDVVEELGQRIVGGTYPVGSILPGEENLVVEFDLSRTVIREALKILTEKGLVQPRPKIGTQVLPRQNWNLLDGEVLNWELAVGQTESVLFKVTEVRRIIEPEAASLAAQRGTEEEIERMAAAFVDLEASADDSKLPSYIAADMVFHAAILEACHNEIIEQMANTLRRALVLSREVTTAIPGRARNAVPLHRHVLEAIQRRDQRAAYTAMQFLVDTAKSDIELYLSVKKRGTP